jgi:biotin transporter BioY
MLAYLFVVLALLVRFVSVPVSFAPVGGALLFFGARGPRRHWWIPVLLLAGADFVLTKFIYGYPYTLDHLITVAWYAAVLLMGRLMLENARPVRVVVAALATSVGFFAISNFGVWLMGNMYPYTLNGLAACYAAAVPFFRKQAVSDVVFTVAMFSVPALIELMKPQAAKA